MGKYFLIFHTNRKIYVKKNITEYLPVVHALQTRFSVGVRSAKIFKLGP